MRHKIYGKAYAVSKDDENGREVTVGSRFQSHGIEININADCNGQRDVTGSVLFKYNKETDKVDVFINCKDYNVIIV